MHAADARPACPVCTRPVLAEPYCECGWQLRAARRLGPVTDDLRADFDGRLAAARHGYDARAAALITAEPGRFARWIRGGAPDSAQWAAARRDAVTAVSGAIDEELARKELATALRGLEDGAQALIIEIGPEGIGITRASMDATGTPRFDAAQPARSWPELLPGLSAHPDERMLQLAGGPGGPGRAALRDCVDKAVQAVQALYGDAVLVVCRPAGWALLEEAAERIALAFPGSWLLRVAAEAAAPGAPVTLGTLTASMPLLRGYGVVVATVDPVTGTVAPATQPLFQPGDVPGAQALVTLRRFPGDPERVTLAVAVDAAWSAEPRVVAVHTVPPPERPLYQVSAVLDASGQVRFTGPRGVTEDSRPWSDVWAGVPRQVDVRPTAVDLVCAIELAGEPGQFSRRRELVRELLEELGREYPDDASPRVSVIGCADHRYVPGEENQGVVRGVPLGPLADALSWLGGQRGEPVAYHDAAPLEELLHGAHRMLARGPVAGRARRLLLVAGRRPHPAANKVGAVPGAVVVHPCPQNYDWRSLSRRLDGAGVRTVVVADAPPARATRAGFWAEVATGGLHRLSGTTARAVGEDLGLFVRDGQQTGLPLPA